MRRYLVALLTVLLVAGAWPPAWAAGPQAPPVFYSVQRSDGGLVLTATASKGLYQPGEPVLVDVTLRNAGAATVNLTLPDTCSAGVGAAVTLPGGQPLLLPQVGKEDVLCAMVVGSRSLAPGEAARATFVWRPAADTPQGYYTLTTWYIPAGTGSYERISAALFVRIGDFADTADHWAADAVRSGAEAGIVAGYPDGSFRPDRVITRAEFFKLLVSGLRLPPLPGGWSGLAPGDHWSFTQGYVPAAVNAGLLYPPDYGGDFGADGPIPRREIVVAAVRALGEQALVDEQTPVLTAPDAGAYPTWLQGWAALALREGILQGYADGSLGLDRTATRAEALVIVQRILAKISLKATAYDRALPPGAVGYPAPGEPLWYVDQSAPMRPVIRGGDQAFAFTQDTRGVRLMPAPGAAVWVSYVQYGAVPPATAGVLARLQGGRLTEALRLDGRSPDLLAVDGSGRLWFADQDRLFVAGSDGQVHAIDGLADGLGRAGFDAAGNLWVVGAHGNPPVAHLYRVTPAGAVTAYPLDPGDGGAAAFLAAGPDGTVWLQVGAPPALPIPPAAPYFTVAQYRDGKPLRRLVLMRYFQAGSDPAGVLPLARDGAYLWLERRNKVDAYATEQTGFYRLDPGSGAFTQMVPPANVPGPYRLLAAPDTGVLLRDADGRLWRVSA